VPLVDPGHTRGGDDDDDDDDIEVNKWFIVYHNCTELYAHSYS